MNSNIVPFKRKQPSAVYRFMFPAFVNLNNLVEAGIIPVEQDNSAILWYVTTTPGAPTRFTYSDFSTAAQELDALYKALTEYQQWVDAPLVIEGTSA